MGHWRKGLAVGLSGSSGRLLVFALMLLLFGATPGQAQEANQPGVLVVGDRVVVTIRASVGSVTPAERAAIVNSRIEHVLSDPNLNPADLEARALPSGEFLLAVGSLPLLHVTQADAALEEQTPEAVASDWSRRLRQALIEVKPLHSPAREKHENSFLPLLLVSVLAFAGNGCCRRRS